MIKKYYQYILASFLYITSSILYFHPFSHNFRETIFMPGGDPEQFIWFLNWWPYAIFHNLNPFLTKYVWYPSGFDLAWATSIPTLSILSTPLTLSLGPTFTWNLLSLIAPSLDALSAFILLKYLYRNPYAAFIGGYIYGFSSYVLGQLLGHLNLDFVCLIPIALLLVIMRLNFDIKKVFFLAFFPLLVVLQAGISLEVLATSTFFGAISLFVFFILESNARGKIKYIFIEILLSYTIAIAILSPLIYYLIIGFAGVPRIINSPTAYSSDLLNYIIPTPITRVGKSIFSSIASRYTGNYAEDGAYLGIPIIFMTLIAIINSYVKTKKRTIAMSAILLFIFSCTLGPILHVNGINTGITMPWSLFDKLPLLGNSLPTRFTQYVSLIVAILITKYLSKSGHLAYSFVLLSIIFIIPNQGMYNWGNQHTPKIFMSNYFNNKNILIFPFGYTGPSMWWQLKSGMKFTMSGGYVGFPPLPFRREQIVNDFNSGKIDSYNIFKNQLSYYCKKNHVRYIVSCNGTPTSISNSLSKLDWEKQSIGQCESYQVPNHLHYYNYSGNVWGSYKHYGWIGKKTTVSVSGKNIYLYLTSMFTPKKAGNVTVNIMNGKNSEQLNFIPGENRNYKIRINSSHRVVILAKETWVPNNVIHNGDNRHLSVSMKIKQIK